MLPARPARPKSVMRTRPSPSSMMLAGLRSRCSTPCSCAAARPAQIWRAISVARSCGKRPMRFSSSARSSPSTYSIVRKTRPSVLADVVDAADVAVRHLARDAHLVVELREPLRIVGDGGGQELQRDAAGRAADRRRDRPRPCRRGRPGRGCGSARRAACPGARASRGARSAPTTTASRAATTGRGPTRRDAGAAAPTGTRSRRARFRRTATTSAHLYVVTLATLPRLV